MNGKLISGQVGGQVTAYAEASVDTTATASVGDSGAAASLSCTASISAGFKSHLFASGTITGKTVGFKYLLQDTGSFPLWSKSASISTSNDDDANQDGAQRRRLGSGGPSNSSQILHSRGLSDFVFKNVLPVDITAYLSQKKLATVPPPDFPADIHITNIRTAALTDVPLHCNYQGAESIPTTRSTLNGGEYTFIGYRGTTHNSLAMMYNQGKFGTAGNGNGAVVGNGMYLTDDMGE